MATRSSSSLFIVLLITSALFVSVSSVIVPTVVRAAPGTVSVSPDPATPGAMVFISGAGWTTHSAGEGCTISASNPSLIKPGSTSCFFTGTGATLSGSFTVGDVPGTPGGSPYTVFVTATINPDQAFDTLGIVAKVELLPIQGRQGQTITVTGKGFLPGSGFCDITSAANVIASYVCQVNGGMTTSATFVVGSAAAGPYTIKVFPTSTPADFAEAPFNIVDKPTLTFSPTHSGHGLSVSVSGIGFSGSDTSAVLTFTGAGGALFSGSPAMTPSTSGPFKNFAGTFTVASSATFSIVYTLTLTGSPIGDLATQTFTLDPADPTIILGGGGVGKAGDSITLTSGNPFSPVDAGSCTVSATGPGTLISSYICQVKSSPPDGTLIGSQFVVSSTAPGGVGVYTVTVTGSRGDSAFATFTVTPFVTFNPTSGSPPIIGPGPTASATLVNVAGTGFLPGTTTCSITPAAASGLIINAADVSCSVNPATGQISSASFRPGTGSVYTAALVTVTVTGNTGGPAPTATFKVIAALALSPGTPPQGSPGTTITYAGSGFTPSPAAACAAAPDVTGTPVDAGTKTCNQKGPGPDAGTVFGQFKIAVGTISGSYLITYIDAGAGGTTATATLLVTGGPVITLTNSVTGTNTGPTSSTVTVSGSGFSAADITVSITATPAAPPPGLFTPSPKTCSVSGGVIAAGCTFAVNSNAAGVIAPGYLVKVTGTETSDFSQANFLLTATLVLTPDTGGSSTVVAMSGSGFLGGAGSCMGVPVPTSQFPIPFFKGGGPTTCNIDGNGVLVGTFTVDDVGPAAPGPHAVTITGAATFVPQGSVSKEFLVTQPSIMLLPGSGSGGDTIQVSGSGFSSGDVSCTIAAPANTIEGTPSCSISGGVVTGSFVIRVPNRAPGILANSILVTGSLGDNARTTLTIVPKITLTPNTSVRVGTVVALAGSNFATAGNCIPTVSSIPAIPGAVVTCTVLADLTVTGSISLPEAGTTASSYEITVKDPATTDKASATLTIMSRQLTLIPEFGPKGASITVTANGFSLGDGVVCTIEGIPATLMVGGSPCSISGGAVTASFIVQNVAGTTPGDYTVRVTGSLGDKGEATFTVTPGLSLLPASGRAGTNVLVSGSNFAAADTGCSITSSPTGLISSPLCTVAGGAMSGSFTVAAGATGGTAYTVFVTGTTGDFGQETFNVPLAPSLTITPNPANAGSVVTASGTNYAGTTCLLTSSPSGLFSASPSCSISSGTLTGSGTIASGASGSYTVTVSTNAGSGDSATSDFSVTAGPTPTLMLTPISGGAGQVVTGAGTGFTADVTCILSAAPSTILSTSSCTITGGGAFTVGFTVAAGASVGTYTILAVGNTGKAASAFFEVTPSGGRTLTLTPNSGRAGAAITVSGLNYVGSTCSLTSSPTDIITSQACSISAGTLTGGFTVAAGATGGVYTVTVTTDIPADTVSVSFTVPSPTFTLAPISGAAGTPVTASGLNYAGTTCQLASNPSTLFTSHTCSISGTGALTGAFTVDSGARARTYTVTVTTSISGETASASFTVPAPTLALTPNSAAAGTAVGISGTNYAGTTCSLAASPSGLISSPTCSISGGILDGGFVVASGAIIGSYTVTVTTNISGETASATFTVPSPSGTKTFTLSPNSGRPGTTITVSGANYVGTSCSLSSSPSGLMSSPTCSIASGTLTGGFTVASAATAGGYTVTVTTNISGETVSTTFTVPSLRPCIIATATFGSEASPAVQYLRNFRDGLVLSTRAGSAFMDVFNAWYYSFSPSVANFIASNDPLRAPVRVMLYPLLGILGVSTLAYSVFSASPEFAVVMTGLVASSLIGLIYFTPVALIGVRAFARRKRISRGGVARASLIALGVALALLTAGELAGSSLLLAVAGSAVVLICIAAVPTIAALMMIRQRSQ